MKLGAIVTAYSCTLITACVATACMPPGTRGETTAPSSAATQPPAYPGLPPQYRGIFHPNRTDLGGRSNIELASLLPVAADFPPGGVTQPPAIVSDDGAGLGKHGEADGQTHPEQCLYTPFGKTFSSAPDGSDWNLYYAASTLYQSDPAGNNITVTVNRERENADVFALTRDWAAKCEQYDKAVPTFASPEVRNRHVVDTFASGPLVNGIQTFVYTTTSTDADDPTADKPASTDPVSKRIELARVRGVVFEVEGDNQAAPQVLDQLMATTITNAQQAPPPGTENADRLGSLPDCSATPAGLGTPPNPQLDCVIRTSDGSGVIFEVRGQPTGTIRVFNSDGVQQQDIREPNAVLQQRLPFVMDVDQDKRQELVVDLATSPSGDLMDIWRARPNTQRYDLTGSVFGFPRFWQTTERFIALSSRTTPDSGVVTIFRFVDNRLTVVALLDAQIRHDQGPIEPRWRLNGDIKCALNTSDDPPGAFGARTDALRAAGIDPANADTHFCNQPWVGVLFRQ